MGDAAGVLPEFEAELFARQSDAATIEFGNSLSARHRQQLFKAYNFGQDLTDSARDALLRLLDAAERAADWIQDAFDSD